jgi:3-phenylpropionate/trans-cinnamate dioxygenase ferredoxin reductase subunit
MMETDETSLLVVGAGHAGSELAIAARQGGWRGRIVLLGDEPELPYHRPPLSKAYLLGEADKASLALRPAQAYDGAGIERLAGVRLAAIDRESRCITLDDGRVLAYDKLALCTGGRPRTLVCAGIDPARPPRNLHVLRTQADAQALRAALRPGSRVLVVGGGYVGLEVAASARKLGAEVTVLEAQPRVLARVAGEAVSRFYERVHREAGVTLLTGAGLAHIECRGGVAVEAVCSHGQVLSVDLMVAGIGMVPNVEAAQTAGLADAAGIAVDELSRTADPHVVAAGDCTVQHQALYGLDLRIESVPNALDQARAAASWLCGKPRPNRAVPWFWSDQYDLKLQMAGLSQSHDCCVLRGDPAERSFCAFYLRAGRLIAVDAVNRPGDFMLARRTLAQQPAVDAERLADLAVPLQVLLAAPGAAAPGKP